MTAPLNQRTERSLQLAIDLGERLFVLLLFASFLVRLSHTLGLRPYNLIVLISEGLVAFFIVIRRGTTDVTMRPLDWVVALAGSVLPMLARADGRPLFPTIVGTVLMFAGLSFAIWAKATLRESFGVAAANRGPVNGGPYRGLRHPMYAGYIVVYIGFFLNNPLGWNLALYAVTIVLMIGRILAEENILSRDPIYANYRRHVRYRLLPGVF
jgi:protein-S-isoprenylcysteine O-methyltransferase Ste14